MVLGMAYSEYSVFIGGIILQGFGGLLVAYTTASRSDRAES